MVAAAGWAPNAGNRRLQPVLAVDDSVSIRLLRAVSPGMVPVPQAVIVIGLDTVRAEEFGAR